MIKPILSMQVFNSIKPGEVIAQGVANNHPNGLYMTDSNFGRELRWVALKGYANDWCLYCHWANEHTWEGVIHQGDKIMSNIFIRNVLDVDDEVMKRYRR